MIELRPYRPEDQAQWNAVVAASRNGNFLHDRRYMDYHADRFEDASLLLTQAGKPVAVLPASRHGNEIVSHGGLTYGGILATEELRASPMLEALRMIGRHYLQAGIERIVYKAIPAVFHRYPCEEDLYALSRCGAQLFRRDVSSVVDLQQPLGFSKGRKWSVNKSRKTGAVVAESDDLAAFHALLSEALQKFDTQPTHSLDELRLLKSRFPTGLRLFECRLDGQLLAATLLYDFGHVVHTQYMASSPQGREEGALDRLIADLMREVFADRRYFSFGISTEAGGSYLNDGLIAQKEGFGARAVVHDFYSIGLQQNDYFA